MQNNAQAGAGEEEEEEENEDGSVQPNAVVCLPLFLFLGMCA